MTKKTKLTIAFFLIIVVITLIQKHNTALKYAAINNATTNKTLDTLIAPTPEITTKQAVTQSLIQKYNKPISALNVEVTEDTGAFAKGTVKFNDEKESSLWYAAKTSNGWILAYDGNNKMPCEVASNYNFPKTMVTECSDK